MAKSKAVLLYLKGVAMGAADIVPGVSGGTIAFITGIYEELLNSIKSVNPSAVKVLFSQGPKAFWQQINGTFLITLIAGIASSFLLLSHLITWAMDGQPLLFWSFIFGLILGSAVHVGKMIGRRSFFVYAAFLVGFALAFSITLVSPAEVQPNYWMIFGAGAIAICAMILPGISGSFMLLLMGLYGFMIQAIKSLNLPIIFIFVAGCVCGLLVFAHLVSYMLEKHRNSTLAFLTGMLFASLNAIWPWRVVEEFYHYGDKIKPLVQKNISPENYQLVTGNDPLVAYCAILAFVGFSLVLFLEKVTDEQ